MKYNTAKKLAIILREECGDDEAEAIKNYSGRGMFGETTAAVSTGGSAVDFGYACGIMGIKPDFRSDAMGLGMVFY